MLCDFIIHSKFWARNKPGDQMRDRYNLNLLPQGITEDMLDYGMCALVRYIYIAHIHNTLLSQSLHICVIPSRYII